MRKQNAQGTTEYLIVIAIVVVIGLLIANLSTNLFDQTQILNTNEQLKGTIGSSGINIIDAIADYETEGILNLKNNSGETLTLTKITTEEGTQEYDNEQWVQGNTELININNLCQCQTNQKTKTCNFEIEYTTKYGIQKKITQTITVNCQTEITTTKTPITPIPPFIFQIKTTENNQEYKFWIDDAVGMQIDWGLGNGWENLADGNALRTQIYSLIGDYNISLKGQASRVSFGQDGSTPELFNDIFTPLNPAIKNLTSADSMFANTEFTKLSYPSFFDEASKNMTNLDWMFYSSYFNENVDNWDTSNVTTMQYMFFICVDFNQNINHWDVSNVTNMEGALAGTLKFNYPLNNWNTSKVNTMKNMFYQSAFNQDISDWNVSNVTNMQQMFRWSDFNQDISSWDVSSVTSCSDFNTSSPLLPEYMPNFTSCSP